MKTKKVVLFLCAMLIACMALGFEIGLKPVNRMMSPTSDGGNRPGSLPNLKLTVTYPSSLVNEGSVVHFTIKVKNDGTAASVPCKAAFIKSLDIIQWFDIPVLGVGASKTFTYNYTVDCGVQVMIWVDDNKNVESNENDNSWAKTFECPVIYQYSDFWTKYKMANLKSFKLPAVCSSCQPWHERLQAGDPVEILNTIADKILDGKGLAEVEGDWKLFLEKNNGLNPRSALGIIFDNTVQKAKAKITEEIAILNFQKRLNNIILGLHNITEMFLNSN